MDAMVDGHKHLNGVRAALFGEEDLIPVKGNADGAYGTVRIPPERTWTITNTFSW